MGNRKVELAHKWMTFPQVMKILNLSRFQLDLRIERKVLPQPTFLDTTGVRYFDKQWVKKAKAILGDAVH